MIKRVLLSKRARKQIKRIPFYIVRALLRWADDVEEIGLEETRKKSGYHDEPLKGDRLGQRSVRLNRAYRAIYEIKDEKIKFVSVEEVSKHDY